MNRKVIESPTLELRWVELPYGNPSGSVPALNWAVLRDHPPEYVIAGLSSSTMTVVPDKDVFDPTLMIA